MTKSGQTEKLLKKNKWSFDDRWIPLVLLFLSVLAFVPLIRSVGFYWDDWPMLWFEITQGPQGFTQAFTSDRPFLGYLYQITGALIGTDPLNWQIVTVLFRWLVSCAFWWCLRLLWPKEKDKTFWIAALLAVYPGFKQMPIAYVWGNAFIMLFSYVVSYGLMLKAIASAENGNRKAYRLWTIAGVITYAFCTVCTEYYTGLDVVRGIIIWIFLLQYTEFSDRKVSKKIRKTIWYWLPYLTVLILFMFWRIFIFQFHNYQPVLLSRFAANPIQTTGELFARVIEDAYTATWGAWTEYFSFPTRANLQTVSDKMFWIAVVVGFLFIFAALTFFRKKSVQNKSDISDATEKKSWIRNAIILGSAAVVFPGIPYLVTSLSPSLDFPRDRWLTAYMFGSCVFLVGLIDSFIRDGIKQKIIVSLFIAMAVGGNLLNTNTYRRDWEAQQDFINQLTTRIPDLDTPAYFLTDFNPLTYETDNSLTGLFNLALEPENSSLTLPVSVGFYDVRFNSSAEKFAAGEPIYQGFRSALFQGETKDIVVYFYSPPGCLRILDPEQHMNLPIFPDKFYEFIPYSHPENILPEGTRSTFLQDEIFKKPVTKNWCYYFQEADLARQYSQWEKIAEIGDQVLNRYQAGEASEYIPFIEAYAQLNRWGDTVPLIEKVHSMNKELDKPLCPILQKLFIEHYPQDQTEREEVASALYRIGCSAYSQ